MPCSSDYRRESNTMLYVAVAAMLDEEIGVPLRF